MIYNWMEGAQSRLKLISYKLHFLAHHELYVGSGCPLHVGPRGCNVCRERPGTKGVVSDSHGTVAWLRETDTDELISCRALCVGPCSRLYGIGIRYGMWVNRAKTEFTDTHNSNSCTITKKCIIEV